MTIDNKTIDGCIKNKIEHQKVFFEYFAPKIKVICIRYGYDEEMLYPIFDLLFDNIKDLKTKTGDVTTNIKEYVIDYIVKTTIEKGIDISNDNLIETDDIVEANKYTPEELLMTLHKLPTLQRLIYNQYVVDGFTMNDIIVKLNLNETTFQLEYGNAKENVKRYLKQIKPI
jgi:hypothetical protein